jgi:hypothetical protein
MANKPLGDALGEPMVKTGVGMGVDPTTYIAFHRGPALIRKGAAALFGTQAAMGGLVALGEAAKLAREDDQYGALKALTQAGMDMGMATLILSQLKAGKSAKDILMDPPMQGPAQPIETQFKNVQAKVGNAALSPTPLGPLEGRMAPVPEGPFQKATWEDIGQMGKKKRVRKSSPLDEGNPEAGATRLFSDAAEKILGLREIKDKRGGRAFHGTDNRFAYFNLEDKAGTGGGGDTFGAGVYLTDQPPIAAGYGTTVRPQVIPRGTRLLDLGASGAEITQTLENTIGAKFPGFIEMLRLHSFPGHWEVKTKPADRYALLLKEFQDYIQTENPHYREALKISKATPMPEFKMEPAALEHQTAPSPKGTSDLWWEHLINWRKEHPDLKAPQERFGGKSVNELVHEATLGADKTLAKTLQEAGVHGVFYKANQTVKLKGLPEGHNAVLFGDDILDA